MSVPVSPRITLALSLAAVLFSTGCVSDASRKKMSDSGSILAGLGPPTPAEAAAMMADPFDADKRYKGVTWISNATWGGADVYLRVYRELIANDKEDPGVRAVCARALAMHGAPSDALLITPLLKSDDKRVRQAAARALQRINNPAVIPDLLLAVDASDRSTVRTITAASQNVAEATRTGLLPPPGSTAPIDPQRLLQRFAAAAAAISTDQWASAGGSVPEKVTAYSDNFPLAFRQVVSRTSPGALTPIVPTGTGAFIFAIVEHKESGELDRDTRQAVACAMGQYADPRVLEALIGTLNDDELAVTRTARESLRILTGHDSGDDPRDWHTWLAAQQNPFAGQTKYIYPNFYRDMYWWEHIPFVYPPPNEPAGTPIGYRPPGE